MSPDQLPPSILVIFGVTGDLSKRYLLPALYHLCKDGLLPKPFIIIGTSRQALELDEFLGQVELCVLEQDNVCDPEVLGRLRAMMQLRQLDPTEPKDYQSLLGHINELEAEQGICLNRLYYLSIPPQIYGPVVKHLGEQGLSGSCAHNKASSRLLIEKPFGFDLVSAEELIAETSRQFTEEQLFRIDHYLAKETVQHLLLFRRQNPRLEQYWNSRYISSVEVAASEQLGVEGRIFYDNIGALRDLIQSHLLQLLALITMDLPQELSSQTIHSHKEALLASLQPPAQDKVAEVATRGQYQGYSQEVNNPDTVTETFASISLQAASERWQGTVLRLVTGKALAEKHSAITVTFSDQSKILFNVQPSSDIVVSSHGGTPELSDILQNVDTDFSGSERPIDHADPNAYERVLIDAIRGDHTLFATSQEVLASWRLVQPVLDNWEGNGTGLVSYSPGATPSTILE